MDKLIAKEVEFNGDILRAAQDPDGNIWVGARWVCEAIGLDDNRIKYERRKMQTDSVISKGVQNFTLLTNGGNQNVMCLQLDYLPLWLAKISITPTMKKEMPGIAEKLVAYQLKAKDVLAAAFLEKKVNNPNVIQLQLPDFNNKIEVLERKVDKIFEDMGRLASMMVQEKIVTTPIPVKKVENPGKKWKNDMYQMIDALTTCDKFSDRGSVMKTVYKYMNKNYGICWDQEVKDYKEKYNPVSKFSTYDVVYANDTLRSNSCGSIKTPSSFTREMNWFCGMIFTIKNVRSGIFRVTYDLETNNKELNDEIKHYYWDEEMLTSAGLLAQIIQRRKTHV